MRSHLGKLIIVGIFACIGALLLVYFCLGNKSPAEKYQQAVREYASKKDFIGALHLIKKARQSLPQGQPAIDIIELETARQIKEEAALLIEQKDYKQAAVLMQSLARENPENEEIARLYYETQEKIFYKSLSANQAEVYDFFENRMAALQGRDVDAIIESWHPSSRFIGAKTLLGAAMNIVKIRQIKITKIDMINEQEAIVYGYSFAEVNKDNAAVLNTVADALMGVRGFGSAITNNFNETPLRFSVKFIKENGKWYEAPCSWEETLRSLKATL